MYPPLKIEPLDDELAEDWIRDIADPIARAVHGVEATKRVEAVPWRWRVGVFAMEHVRGVPLEVELRRRIAAALRGVTGVVQAEEEDREAWVVRGEPAGSALVAAVAVVVDACADDIRAALASRPPTT